MGEPGPKIGTTVERDPLVAGSHRWRGDMGGGGGGGMSRPGASTGVLIDERTEKSTHECVCMRE